MELFPSDYTQADDATSQAHDQSAPAPADVTQLQDSQAGPSVGILQDGSVNDVDSDPPLRGKAATHGLSNEEKKERQKQQNRRAAERSRNKKREELTALEMTVNNIQDENHRLRSRLSALLAAKVPEATQPSAEAEAPVATAPLITATLDYEGLSKLQTELASAKTTLSSKEIELGRLRGEVNDSGQGDEAQHQLVAQTASLKASQAEVASLHSLIGHLRADRDSLARQCDVLSHEISARRALREFVADAPSTTSSRANGVERALLELRGLVDGVVKTWEQSSVLTSISPSEPNAQPSSTQVDEKE